MEGKAEGRLLGTLPCDNERKRYCIEYKRTSMREEVLGADTTAVASRYNPHRTASASPLP